MINGFFVTGIGTDVGKTVVSAMLVSGLKADYWKPIQSGELDQSDAMKVKAFTAPLTPTIHPERYKLTKPLSPHASSRIDGIEIELTKLLPPHSTNKLIIEGAGGVLVPLNPEDLVIDYISLLEIPVILVSRNYLGSINHTLLSIEALKHRGIEIAGIIFNGEENRDTQSFIAEFSGVPIIGRIPFVDSITPEFIATSGARLADRLQELAV